MTEKLLQFIWQFKYFNQNNLLTVTGERIQIIHQGIINHNQGPDFLNARIQIGSTIWAGTVELHVKASDWKKHNHEGDKNYNTVVLHVVWLDDGGNNTFIAPGQAIPVFELQGHVSKILLQRYEELMKVSTFISCERSIQAVSPITWHSWKQRLMAERLLRKASQVEMLFRQSNNHWEETFWWLLARNFGLKVNGAAFESIARSIPVTILAKHKNQIHQLECLLFGQGGLLESNFKEDYPRLLQKEYKFLQSKYQLKPSYIPLLFLRMRPVNFPTIRLAQLASLVNESAHLFSKIKEAGSVQEIKRSFDVTANDYWHYHYQFDETGEFKKKKLGSAMIDNIIINTISPVLFAYGNYHHENKYRLNAIRWLEETAAENNAITKGFQVLNIENGNASDSQALVELKNEYCNNRKCLECSIGNAILRNE